MITAGKGWGRGNQGATCRIIGETLRKTVAGNGGQKGVKATCN